MNDKPKLNKPWKKWLVIVSAGIALALSLPRNSAFKYEFQRGKDWNGNDIITPFSFPIYKTIDEIATERNEIISLYKPYFHKDMYLKQRQMLAFSVSFDSLFQGRYQTEKGILMSLISDVYNRGILRKTDIPENFASRVQLEIAVLSNNVSEDYPISEFFTPGDAYNYILSKFRSVRTDTSKYYLLPKIDIRKYIQTNLEFDEATTEKVKRNALENISQTRGIIQAGTKILSTGELINSKNIKILESYKREYMEHEGFLGNYWLLVFGQAMFVSACLFLLYLLLLWYQPEILNSIKNTVFILLLVIISVFVTMQVLKHNINIYVVPLTIVPIYLSAFFRSRTAMFVFLTILLIIGYYAPSSFDFIFVTFAAGIVSVSEFRTWYNRGRLFISIGFILLAYVVSYTILIFIQGESFISTNLTTYVYFLVNIALVLLAYQFIYIFEKIFGFLSNSTLLELSDTNRDLLRQLAENAPGTFQHSLQVSNLAEEVVRQLKGDTLLVRAGALYHDIGKMLNAQYFIENENNIAESLHKNMLPQDSAKIIIKHVEDGVALAKKHNLHPDIINFIRTHHATSQTKYFVSKYKEQNPGASDFSAFTYPGPNPWTKEQAIFMLADSIEAASRTLPKYTPETIGNLVDNIIKSKIECGYLSAADITFSELTLAKDVFKAKLKNIYHARIEYPKD